MSPVNATAKGEKQDKAVADRLRAEDRERYRAFGKLLAEIKADVVDVSGTNGCGALRQMLSAEVQLLPEHASKVRQYLHERPEDKGIAMRHTGMLTYVDPSANITRVDDARVAYPIPHTRCPADERDRARSIIIVRIGIFPRRRRRPTPTPTRPRAPRTPRARAPRPAHASRARQGHYVTRMAVGNKNVTLLVVHFDEDDWSCARREAAATIVANEAARTRRGGLGFGGESPGGVDQDYATGPGVVVVVRRQDAGGRPRGHRQWSPAGAGPKIPRRRTRRTRTPWRTRWRSGAPSSSCTSRAAFSSGRRRRRRRRGARGARSAEEEQDPAMFLSKTLVEWTTSVTASHARSDAGESKEGSRSPIVVDITFKAYCAFSGDVDTWEEFLDAGRRVRSPCLNSRVSACGRSGYTGCPGKDEGPHWMKNFYRWQMDVPTLEEFLAEEERLNELEEREEAEAEARERSAAEGGGKGVGETAVENRDEDGSS